MLILYLILMSISPVSVVISHRPPVMLLGTFTSPVSANIQNMQMIQAFVDGDETIIKQVNQRAWQSAIVLIVLLVLIALMIWALVSFGSDLYSLVAPFIFCV